MPLRYWKRSSPTAIVYTASMVYYQFVQQKGAASLKSVYCKFIDVLIAEKYFENEMIN